MPLGREIVAVISCQVTVGSNKAQAKMDRGAGISTLAVKIEIPT
jgi:septum formation topological specificity factor MinE